MELPRDVEGVRVLAEKLAREHAANGGKVVGYVTPSVPAELIAGAGLYPIMLSAGMETSTVLGDRVMEDLFDTSVRGIFERLLKGEFDFLSAIVLPRANDSAHRLYYYLCELKRTGEAKLPPVLLCDVVMTPDEATRKYSIEAVGRLWDQLRALGNAAATDKDVRVSAYLQGGLDQTLFPDRRRFGPTLRGGHALALFAATRMLPSQLAGDMERDALKGPPLAEGPRVIVCGSAQYDSGLYDLVENAAGVIVGDYHAMGDLSVRRMHDRRRPVFEDVVDILRGDNGASRRFVDPGPHVAEFARDCRATHAIFSFFPEEEALTWDYPEQKAALAKIGVKVLRLSEQARPFDVAAHRDAVAAFVKGGGA